MTLEELKMVEKCIRLKEQAAIADAQEHSGLWKRYYEDSEVIWEQLQNLACPNHEWKLIANDLYLCEKCKARRFISGNTINNNKEKSSFCR